MTRQRSRAQQRDRNNGGIVHGQALQRKLRKGLNGLAQASEAERLRLAVLGAKEAVFDWTLSDDRIVWDGAPGFLELHPRPERLRSGAALLAWMNTKSREVLCALIDETEIDDPAFALEFPVTTREGSAFVEMRAVRLLGPGDTIERIAGIMRDVTERRKREDRLSYLATRDELTGHLNRTRLREELSRKIASAKTEERSCAYFVAAIDKLAVINETYGFDIADDVLVATGKRLEDSLRTSDVIGRTAGNKFGVIVSDCGEEEMAAIAERLAASVRSEVIQTRAGMVSATISIGAVWLPEGASTSQEAMLRAEEAIEKARSSGRNGFAVYAKSAQRESARRRLMTIADDIVAALKEDRLVFAYQPIVDAKSREAKHWECLLRLKRTDGTIATAGEFIPAAEQLGLVRLVDRRVLEMAVQKLHAHPDVRLSINVSGTTAGDPSWLQSFISYVKENREVAERMTLELTETAAIHAFEENAKFVSRLRDMGCRVAIDDFGAGFTSFRNLQMLRVDTVKIDGAYVKGLTSSPDNQIFVRTLVELAKNFRLETVAEWVGTEDEAKMLESFGVDYFQGFYLGQPDLAPEWLKE